MILPTKSVGKAEWKRSGAIEMSADVNDEKAQRRKQQRWQAFESDRRRGWQPFASSVLKLVMAAFWEDGTRDCSE